MNFNLGGPSNYSTSSVSLSESDNDNKVGLTNHVAVIDAQIEVVSLLYNNNNILLNQQQHQPIHGGSVPGHIVIHCDREAAIRS